LLQIKIREIFNFLVANTKVEFMGKKNNLEHCNDNDDITDENIKMFGILILNFENLNNNFKNSGVYKVNGNINFNNSNSKTEKEVYLPIFFLLNYVRNLKMVVQYIQLTKFDNLEKAYKTFINLINFLEINIQDIVNNEKEEIKNYEKKNKNEFSSCLYLNYAFIKSKYYENENESEKLTSISVTAMRNKEKLMMKNNENDVIEDHNNLINKLKMDNQNMNDQNGVYICESSMEIKNDSDFYEKCFQIYQYDSSCQTDNLNTFFKENQYIESLYTRDKNEFVEESMKKYNDIDFFMDCYNLNSLKEYKNSKKKNGQNNNGTNIKFNDFLEIKFINQNIDIKNNTVKNLIDFLKIS
jgi:hypothetical protein